MYARKQRLLLCTLWSCLITVTVLQARLRCTAPRIQPGTAWAADPWRVRRAPPPACPPPGPEPVSQQKGTAGGLQHPRCQPTSPPLNITQVEADLSIPLGILLSSKYCFYSKTIDCLQFSDPDPDWIRIQSVSGFNQYPDSRSVFGIRIRIQKSKNDPQNKKKNKEFHVL
jgi:hypothetical protein